MQNLKEHFQTTIQSYIALERIKFMFAMSKLVNVVNIYYTSMVCSLFVFSILRTLKIEKPFCNEVKIFCFSISLLANDDHISNVKSTEQEIGLCEI